MTHAVIASCFNPIAYQLPPFLGVKFRVKTPPTRFLLFLNALVFPAF